jgi:16S rRNA (cytosine967-C5)-methyltransferase
LLDAVKQAWPCSWQSVLDANNVKPPMTLRVNERQYSRDEYLQLLTDQGIKAQALTHSPVGVGLEQPTSVTALPLFEQGAVSVQDQAAQLAAGLLQHRPGERVLDVCAAPGGKAMHILEAEPALQQLVALDIDAQRATRITDSLRRHQFSAEVVVADATRPEDWWDGQQFDRILLDAPCSALGVIRRHPDIKMLRRARDIDTLVKTQVQILDAVWPLLKRGGVMLYATCSILPQENSEQITRFLQRHDDAMSVTLNPGWGLDAKPGRQILPGDDNMDGFFYARVDKL